MDEDLRAELAALKARVVELEAKGRPIPSTPPGPIRDLTANMSMPKEALQTMVDAVPSAVVREIVKGDRVRADLRPLGGRVTPPLPRSRNLNPAPLDVPGIALADKLMDHQDRLDRDELAQRLAKQEIARRAAKAKPDAA
jgi:hypothetical protein